MSRCDLLFDASNEDDDRDDVGLCPAGHREDFIQVAEGFRRRIVRKGPLDVSVREWDRDEIGLADGLYCRRCSSLGTQPEPFTAAEAASVIGNRLTERRLERHDPSAPLDDLVAAVTSIDGFQHARVVHEPATPAQRVAIPEELVPELAARLTDLHLGTLYSHQAAAIRHALDGTDVMSTTGTGSGKTLGLLVPIIDGLLRDPDATALVLIPRKVLNGQVCDALCALAPSRDDLGDGIVRLSFGDGLPHIDVAVVNGDVQGVRRSNALKRARIIISNHFLAHETMIGTRSRSAPWDRFIDRLRVVAIDEIDVLRGVDTEKFAQTVRRLLVTVAERNGRDPQVLSASATVVDPVELHREITGRADVAVVSVSGAARAERTVIFVGTGLSDDPKWRHRTATEILCALVAARPNAPAATLVFDEFKDSGERLGGALRDELRRAGHCSVAGRIGTYNGEHDQDVRRDSESSIERGDQLITVATSALATGVDIGRLSVTLLLGPHNSPADIVQRIGRVGRTGPGLAIVICADDPLGRALLAADDPMTLLRTSFARPVGCRSDAIARTVFVEPLIHEFGHVPVRAMSMLDAETIARLCATGDFSIADDGSLIATDVVGAPRSLVDNPRYLTVKVGRTTVRLTGHRLLTHGFRKATILVNGHLYRIEGFEKKTNARTSRADGELENNGVIDVTLDEFETAHSTMSGRARMTFGAGVLRMTRVATTDPSRPNPHDNRSLLVDDVGAVDVEFPIAEASVSTELVTTLAEVIEEHGWRIGITRHDIRVLQQGNSLRIVDQQSQGRTAWAVATRLVDLIAFARAGHPDDARITELEALFADEPHRRRRAA
jgi:superfamily II DNA/RNA helicase